jgi:HK97 family phage portal protein
MSLLWRKTEQRTPLLSAEQLIAGRTRTRNVKTVTPEQALRHSTVWACHDLIARTVATLPWRQFRAGDDVAPVNPSPLLLTPSRTLSLVSWRYAVMSCLLLRGNAYGVVSDIAGNGFPARVELLHPDDVTIRQVDGEWVYQIRGRRDPLPASDVWHVAAYNQPGSPLGLSPIAHAATSIGLGIEAQQHGHDWFADGAHPSSIVYADTPLDREQAQSIKTTIRQSFGSGEPAVLGSGLEWKAVQVAPNESQFLETISANGSLVCQWFGVSPEMVGLAASAKGSMTYTNREQRAIDFLTFTLRPWLVRLEEAMSELVPRGNVVHFNSGALLKTDLKTRYESYRLALDASTPWLTVDEVRRLEDRPPMEDDQ